MRLLLALLLTVSGSLCAATENAEEAGQPTEEPAPAAASCATVQHRQFDFWIGEWDVTVAGEPAGHNRIELATGGCALAEFWTSAHGGFSGRSLNMYDAVNDRWHQTWVDSSGALLQLDGGLVNGRMVLEGFRRGGDGAQVRNRITWTPNPDGSVRQHWETNSDGEEWTTVFDGLYVRSADQE